MDDKTQLPCLRRGASPSTLRGVRALIIGTGSIGRRHIGTLQALETGTKFVLLRRGALQDAWSSSLRAAVTGTVAEALALKPDFCVIATPSALHHEALLPVIDAGLPFYVEKPVVTSRAQLESLAGALDRTRYSSATLAGCNLRFLPSLRKLKEVLGSGAAGRIVRASFQAGQWLPDWRKGSDHRSDYSASETLGGGVIFDLVHELDAVRWLLGEFHQVRTMAGSYSSLMLQTEDAAVILLGRPGGPAVSVGLDYVSRHPIRRYELVGEEATLVWDLPDRRLTRAAPEGVETIDAGPDGYDVAATYRAAMKEFLDSVRSGRPTSQDVHEGLRSAELAIRAKEMIGP